MFTRTKNIWQLCIILTMMSAFVKAQSLDDYLKIAAENNPGVKAAYLEFEASMQRLPQVSSLPDPALSMSALGQMIETRVGTQEARFSLMQSFPWFGTLKAKKEVAALEADAKFQAYLDRRNELFFKVKTAYYELYEVKHHIHHKMANGRILETFRTLALSKFENGTAPMTDVIRVDIMQNDNRTDIEIFQDSRKPIEVQFNRLLNRPDTLFVSIPDSIPMLFDKEIVLSQQNLSENPRVQQWDKKMQAAQAQEKVAVKSGFPDFGLGIDYSIISERSDVNFSDNGQDAIMPVVSISLPIFRKKYKAAQQEANLLQKAYSEMKTETENQLSSTWETNLFELEKAQKQIELYQSQTQKTQQTLELILSAYENGTADIQEILTIQQQLIKYKMAVSASFRKYMVTKSYLDYLNGKTQ
ncbi:MAG: TolC family protein [Flavobacteriaceae bacterium]|nr:TolC family protein [Flavobacteriaceae bacterium]